MSKAKYYANNWQHWHDAPDGWSDGQLPTFEEFMEYKIGGWEIPSSHTHIVRAYNKTTGKVTEYDYRRQDAAMDKIEQLVLENNYDLCLVDHETIRFYRNKNND